MMLQLSFCVCLPILTTLSSVLVVVESFSIPHTMGHRMGWSSRLSSNTNSCTTTTCYPFDRQHVILALTSRSSDGKKKRRRRRKEAPMSGSEELTTPISPTTTTTESSTSAPSSSSSPPLPSLPIVESTASSSSVVETRLDDKFDVESNDDDIDIATIRDVANFSFEGSIEGLGSGPSGASLSTSSSSSSVEIVPSSTTPKAEDGAIPLPDIKDALKRKEVIAEMARMEEEQAERKKIDRNDRAALLKLLEQQPYADADDSFFEEQEYTTVSALLGERARPFLGIPTGPLQVGHFIGALVIVLMAFIEYPGFPLTNLPTPLRGALQGGLGVVYAINTVLAVLAVFKAGERGQPAILWIAKTFSVGGLAYDQLTQLPTLEEVEKAKARKGKRAVKAKAKNKYY